MKWSGHFIQTQKETPSEAEAISHQLMIRAGLIRLLTSGVYSYLPLGLRALQKIEGIIREEMNRAGAAELLLPALQPADLWQTTGRYETLGKDMISFKDRHGKLNVLGPTHEEVITALVKGEIKSYRQLPLILYQIQTKFRDEARPRFGVIRSREFIMKDAYSFDADEKSLSESYQKMLTAYEKIFKRCSLTTWVVEADPGIMGGSRSHEFIVPTESGESVVGRCESCQTSSPLGEEDAEPRGEKRCPKCRRPLAVQRGLEVGHIFQLGTKYSASLDATYLDDGGARKPILMGCYGIGVTRVLAAIIEEHHDGSGIMWPKSAAPFQAIVLPLLPDEACMKLSQEIYREGGEKGWELLLDDREERTGVKFKDADLIGIPFQLIVGKSALQDGKFEIKERKSGETLTVSRPEIFETLKRLYQTPEERISRGVPKGGELETALREAISEILKGHETELVEFSFRREGSRHVLRILVDTPQGIRLEECASLNQAIGQMLDERDLIPGSYLLEVSSPGLDRPLVTERDLKRALGKPVRLFLKTPFLGQTQYEGTLEDTADGKIVLRVAQKGMIEIPFETLLQGKRIIEF